MSKALKMIQAELRKGKRRGGADLPTKGRRVENEYGLTFMEWMRAAGFDTSELKVTSTLFGSSKKILVSAWRRGEDPSDYRAER